MECSIRWQGEPRNNEEGSNMAFQATTGSGHSLCMDGPPELGGANLGARPMELLLAGAGGCSAIDVVKILQKSRQAISGCEVKLQAERADSEPKVFTHIHLHYIVSGHALKEEAVERAITLSKEKYCSASIMLAKTAKITHDYELVDLPTDN